MERERLQLLGPYDAWHGAAHLGRLGPPEAVESAPAELDRVLVLLGPENTSADGLQRSRAGAVEVMNLHHDHVLPLLAVVRHGARTAWVYRHVDVLGLGHTVASDAGILLSTRAAAEAVALVAETLVDVGGPGWRHPGPEPDDLLLEPSGRLWVAGFVSPFPSSPAMRAPHGEVGEAAVVYRLGVLLAHLVSGVSPGPPSTRGSHGALVRRALIRAMARPGPVLTERYGDWLRGMLTWDPAERPPLSTVPDGLRKVADATGGPSLVDWADAHVRLLQEDVSRAAATRRADHGTAERSLDAMPTGPQIVPGRTPAPARPRIPAPDLTIPPGAFDEDSLPPVDDLADDDPTQEDELASDEVRRSRRPMSVRSLPPGPIPVQVGPPPEAVMTRRPSLPSAFLDAPPVEGSDGEVPVSGLPAWQVAAQALWIPVAALAVIASLLTLLNVALYWDRAGALGGPAPVPTLKEVIETPAPVAPDRAAFAVEFQGPAGMLLHVRCGDTTERGVGTVTVELQDVGACLVQGEGQGVKLIARREVAGPANYRCFEGGREQCR